MQFLLAAVNAKYIHSNPAIYSLRAYAGEELRPHIALAEYTINNRMEDILSDLYRRKPDAIGFSCYIWNWKLIGELLGELPKVLPRTELWLGGPEVSFGAEEILKSFPMVRGIMAGEGEETFRELLARYVRAEQRAGGEVAGHEVTGHEAVGHKVIGCEVVGGEAVDHKVTGLMDRDFRDIPGLVLREGATPPRSLADINHLPFLYENLQEFENRIVYYETGRGCPFRCSYCLSSVDKRVRLKSPDTVERELQFFLDRRVSQVKLTDRTFNCDHSHAVEIWRYIKEHDNGVTNFHFEIGAELLSEDETALLKSMRPGLMQLEVGVQSANPRTLREVGRREDIRPIGRAVAALRENNNIHIHLDLIAGLPFEDYDSFKKSFNAVYAMRPHQLQLGFLKVLKGTLIRERAEAYGIVFQEKPPYEVLYTKWLSYGELLRLKQIEEMVELYHNSGQFTHTLAVLERDHSGPFELFERLADFYGEKGCAAASPARSRRYRILLEFITDREPEKEEMYRELLTYDYYLREKPKSRPDFCRGLAPWRQKIWSFYQKEEKEPHFLKGYRQYHARETMRMTHVEAFFYPVWEAGMEAALERSREPKLVLFDYREKDPVTGNCKVKVNI